MRTDIDKIKKNSNKIMYIYIIEFRNLNYSSIRYIM